MHGYLVQHRQRLDHDRPYWLPPVGTGNGLSAAAWAPIADLTAAEALQYLNCCARARVAAYVSPRDGGRPGRRQPVVYRVWVASEHFGAAEDALRDALAELNPTQVPRR